MNSAENTHLENQLLGSVTSAGVAAVLGRREQMGQAITVGEDGEGRDFLLTRDATGNTRVEEIKPLDFHGNLTAKPSRIVQVVEVETQDSLEAYVRDFKTASSRLFASISASTITAVLDYHQGRTDALASGVEVVQRDAMAADFGQNTAMLRLPFSEEWERWAAADGKLFDQQSFARTLHENRTEISEPDAATVIDAVRDLRAARNVTFTPEVSMTNNTESFSLSDTTDVSRRTGSLDIPASFVLRLPVYFGGEVVQIEAALRTEVVEGRLMLGIKLMRRENVRQAVFQRAVLAVTSATGVPVVYGHRG